MTSSAPPAAAVSKPIRAWQADRTGIGSQEMDSLLATSYGDPIAPDVVRVSEHVSAFSEGVGIAVVYAEPTTRWTLIEVVAVRDLALLLGLPPMARTLNRGSGFEMHGIARRLESARSQQVSLQELPIHNTLNFVLNLMGILSSKLPEHSQE